MKHRAVLRLATPEDAQYMLDIYAPYVQSTMITFEYEVPSLSEFVHRIETKIQHYPWIVCEIEGVIAGYAYASSFRERAAYMWDAELSVYVSEEYHGRRIATALYTSLIDLLKLQGFRNVYGGITSPNPPSQRLHEKFGFEVVGVFRKTGNKFGQWADVTFYAMNINPYEEEPKEPLSILDIDPDEIEDILKRNRKGIKASSLQDTERSEDSSDISSQEIE